MVITEYGVADLRGRTDRDVIVALLKIADSRFQPVLLEQAKASGKLERGYALPAEFRDNTPGRLAEALAPARAAGLAPLLPFGSDFDPLEQSLLPTLGKLKAAQAEPMELLRLVLRGLARDASAEPALKRLDLDRPRGLTQWLTALALRGALRD
jgi:hypothetical protein